MSELQIWTEFFEGEKNINIVQLDDKAFWFQASHLCKLLGYKNATVALQTHCEDYEIQKLDIGQHEDVNFVSESGFYSLVLGSKKPKAKKFKKWVCSEVLPKLRASGGYIMPTATSEQLEALQQEIAFLQERQSKVLDVLKTRRVDYFAYQLTLKETLALAKSNLMGASWDSEDLTLFQIHEKQAMEMRRSERLNNAAKSCQRYF